MDMEKDFEDAIQLNKVEETLTILLYSANCFLKVSIQY